jgi:hypothetical protein
MKIRSNRKLEIDLSAVQGSADFHLLQEFSASGVCLKEDLHL